MSIFSFLGGIVGPIGKIIDDVTTSEEERLGARAKLAEVENILRVRLLEYEDNLAQSRRDIVVAEIKSQSWLARNWRPMTMISFVIIIINNYILVPYATAFGASIPALDIPPGMWALLNVGIGGYIVGRSAEKAVKTWKNGAK